MALVSATRAYVLSPAEIDAFFVVQDFCPRRARRQVRFRATAVRKAQQFRRSTITITAETGAWPLKAVAGHRSKSAPRHVSSLDAIFDICATNHQENSVVRIREVVRGLSSKGRAMTLTTPVEHENTDDPKLGNPLLDHLGLKLVLWDIGRCEFELAISARHLNRQSSLHGGVVATLLDAACGYAGLIATPNAKPGNAWTVMLTISYLDKTARGKIRAVGQVTRSGRSLYFSTGKLLTEDGHLLATAQGTLKRAKDGGVWPTS
jgi:uncharacterized protein (TIGR00369 family)